MAVSEYTFGDFDPEMSGAGEPQIQEQQGPKWFRDYMDRVSGQLKDLQAENAAMKAEKARSEVADALKAKGYAPNAAELYQGTPDKLDDWLSAHGGALAKLAPEGQEQGEVTPQGPPPSTVSATDQAQMQRMQEAGTQGVLPPQGSEAELVQRLKTASPEEFAQIMRSHGSPHDWT
jgi:hypothetical protein